QSMRSGTESNFGGASCHRMPAAKRRGGPVMTGTTITTAAPRSHAGAGATPGARGTGAGAAAPVLTGNSSQSKVPARASGTVDREPDVARQWPMGVFLELGAWGGAAPPARLHARQIMWEWQLTPLTEAVEQVVAELVTNSVAAARAMPLLQSVCLWLLS